MSSIILVLIPLPFIVFWLWMFWAMLQDELMPPNIRQTWILAFIVLNIFTAGYYYFNVYRNSH